MGLFTPTAEELDNAKNGGRERIEWKDGEQPTLLITEYKEFPDKNLDIIVTKVVGGDHDGKEQPIFFRTDNKYDMEDGLALMYQFFTREQLLSKQASQADLIGNKITCKVKLSKGKEEGKVFTNFKYYKRVDDAPQLHAVSNSDIPF